MDIYPHTPYTYRIKWSSTGVSYYGVRYATGCHPNDLWTTYFTSSKHVLNYRESHGEPDIIEIRKVFNGPDKVTQARLFETKVLRRLDVLNRNDYLNRNVAGAIPPMLGANNPMHNPKNKEIFLQAVRSPEHREKQRQGVKKRTDAGCHPFLGPSMNKSRVEAGTHQFLGGEIQGQTSRARVANGTHNFLGMAHKMLAEGTHPSQKSWECECCGKQGFGSTNYKRWHGPNCRSLLFHQAKQ